MMKRVLQALVALSVLTAPSLFAADPPKQCTLCAGVVSDLQHVPAQATPLYMEASEGDLSALSQFVAGLPAETRNQSTAIVDIIIPAGTSIDEVERRIEALTTATGPSGLRGFGVSLGQSDPALAGYALKRLAVKVEGLKIAQRIALKTTAADLPKLYDTGAQAYFDEVVVDSENVSATAEWLAAHDPSKRIIALAPGADRNPLFDAAKWLAAGATEAFVQVPNDDTAFGAFRNFDDAMSGDYAFDSSAGVELLDRAAEKIPGTPLAFVRGEDLRTLVVPPGETIQWRIASIQGADLINPRRISASGNEKITDTGSKNGRTLVGLPPSAGPFALTLDRPNLQDSKITKESIEVTTHKGITVEEIIRNHQAYKAFQSSIEPRYIAQDDTKLRFSIGPGGDSIESTIAGRYFSSPGGPTDWVWDNFYINGVRWKYGQIPELPIIQPEKVAQLPLDIHLTNDYRYELVGETTVRGYHVYEVRFTPPPDAPAALPLYRGTVWIDSRTWARIRIDMIQLNLSGEILSNDEKVDFAPFDRASGTMLTTEEAGSHKGDQIIWLPLSVGSQQVLSVAGGATPVLRATDFTKFELRPADFAERKSAADASNARIVRDTGAGMRYLDKNDAGERVVRPTFDTAKLFLLGGLHHDPGLQYKVAPLGGIDYFNFDLDGKGIQENVFFAGILATANFTNPSFMGTRTNAGIDFFGIAIPFENSVYENGKVNDAKTVKTFPVSLSGRVGHPIFGFGKVDLSLDIAYLDYQRDAKTAPDFAVPPNTFEITPRVDARYDRTGYSALGFFEHGTRTTVAPWGDLDEYSPKQREFDRWGVSVGKTFYLPKFQRIGIELDDIGGNNLDRFSKFELGFFGSERVRGVASGSVRAEKGQLGHLSYGFVVSDQFRLEAFYDYALVDDASAGYSHTPFEGIGIGGQTIGPFGTLLRLDLGKTIGPNAQNDFVANVVLLKLFDRSAFRRLLHR